MAEEKKRLDLKDPQVWNKWRELYHDLTHEENQVFGRDIEAEFPTQDHATHSNYDLLFQRYPETARVLEVGGWKGHLAKYCLGKYPISHWVNIEYCEAAACRHVVLDSRFEVWTPENFHWFRARNIQGEWDAFIAAHVIEHLVDEDLVSLIEYLKGIPVVMFEAPISRTENDWTDYGGTHILKIGWNGVNDLMKSAGYKAEEINESCFLYTLT